MILWTIYKHPKDFPSDYVARKWTVTQRGPEPSPVIMVNQDLDQLRNMLPSGLYRLERNISDDPCIVEVWL